ncbi:sensor histidine kinase [Geodermatophilus sp. TF02-6]|uniref:sensor histidine kinase n=1 Tax=Geodermatophilus sp. TF02-6 TaxID=2250575 RepID=UPI000DEAF865|nr:histidine kinase [Geodermatophilus sp. TF02-6]RBY76129.1 sensor histidine kinase [Geodermatophilus sp. TF02-6]
MTPSSAGTPAGGGEQRPAREEQGPAPGRFAWLFAAVWLVYLISPLRRAWTAAATPLPLRVLAVAALVGFAAGFCWFFAWFRRRRLVGAPPAPTAVWRVLGAGLLLLVLAASGAGEESLAGLVYIGVAAVMTLPLRQSAVVVAGVVALITVLPRVVPGWTPQDGVVPGLLLGCLAAFGVGQVITRNAELLRAREQLVDLAVTRERARLARDVHDILGHSLTVITVKTELAGRLLEAAPGSPALDRVRAEVADVERLAREALADVRATASGMRSVSLTGELAAARRALDAAGIAADLPSAVDVVPARHRELFAWTLREGVTNVVRHSGARRCTVRLTADCVEVRDDGRGHDSTGDDGSGLAGLRSRAQAAGARVETGRSPEGGFLLRVVAEPAAVGSSA